MDISNMHKQEIKQCLFCEIQANNRERIIAENSLVYAIRDGFPVTDKSPIQVANQPYFSALQINHTNGSRDSLLCFGAFSRRF
jgi:hypothetical protein